MKKLKLMENIDKEICDDEKCEHEHHEMEEFEKDFDELEKEFNESISEGAVKRELVSCKKCDDSGKCQDCKGKGCKKCKETGSCPKCEDVDNMNETKKVKVEVKTKKGKKGTKSFESRSSALEWLNENASIINNAIIIEEIMSEGCKKGSKEAKVKMAAIRAKQGKK